MSRFRRIFKQLTVAALSLAMIVPAAPQQVFAATSNFTLEITEDKLYTQYYFLLEPKKKVTAQVSFPGAKSVSFAETVATGFDEEMSSPRTFKNDFSIRADDGSSYLSQFTDTSFNFVSTPAPGKAIFTKYNSVVANVELQSGETDTVEFVFLCADWYRNASVDVANGYLYNAGTNNLSFPTAYKIGTGDWVYENRVDKVQLPSNLKNGDTITVGWPKDYTKRHRNSANKVFITNLTSRTKSFVINKRSAPSLSMIQIFEPDNQDALPGDELEDDGDNNADEGDDDFFDDEDDESDGDIDEEDEQGNVASLASSGTPLDPNGIYKSWFKLSMNCEYFIGTRNDALSSTAVWKTGTGAMQKENAKLTDHIFIRYGKTATALASDFVDAGLAVKQHTYNSWWSSDSISHWHTSNCLHPNLITERALHTFGGWTVTKKATTSAKGTKTCRCTVCGYVKTASIPKVVPAPKPASKTVKSTPAQSAKQVLNVQQSSVADTTITVQWNKISNATGYYVYGAKGKGGAKKIATIKGAGKTSWKQTKLKKNTYYNYYVAAYRTEKKKTSVIAKSKKIFIVTNGGKNGNYSKVKFAKASVSVKKGKTVKVKISATVPKGKKIKKFANAAYSTSNKSIATVTKGGVVKGVKKGTCYITARVQNGKTAKVKITVN